MAAVRVLDDYYLAITFLVTVTFQLFFFSIAFTLKFDKLTDFAGGTNFILLAILTLAFSENRDNARNIVASVFIMVWAARLSGFLLFRILKTGKDDRFDDKRDKFWSFLGFWVLYVLGHHVLCGTAINKPQSNVLGVDMFSPGHYLEFAQGNTVQSGALWNRMRYCRHCTLFDWFRYRKRFRHPKVPFPQCPWE